MSANIETITTDGYSLGVQCPFCFRVLYLGKERIEGVIYHEPGDLERDPSLAYTEITVCCDCTAIVEVQLIEPADIHIEAWKVKVG